MKAEAVDEWRDFGDVLDRLLFVISVIVLSCVIVWMIAKGSESPVERGIPYVTDD